MCCSYGDIYKQRTTREADVIFNSARMINNTPDNSPKLHDFKDGICGKSAFNLTNRIVGGESTLLGEHPWMAVLLYEKSMSKDCK